MSTFSKLVNRAVAVFTVVALLLTLGVTAASAAPRPKPPTTTVPQLPISGTKIKAVGTPALVSRSQVSRDIIVRGSNDVPYALSWDANTGFGSWQSLGGAILSNPVAVATSPTTTLVVARGTNNYLYVQTFSTASGWSGWNALSDADVQCQGDPAVAMAGSAVSIACRTIVGEIKVFSGGVGWWRAPKTVATEATTDPALVIVKVPPFFADASWVDEIEIVAYRNGAGRVVVKTGYGAPIWEGGDGTVDAGSAVHLAQRKPSSFDLLFRSGNQIRDFFFQSFGFSWALMAVQPTSDEWATWPVPSVPVGVANPANDGLDMFFAPNGGIARVANHLKCTKPAICTLALDSSGTLKTPNTNIFGFLFKILGITFGDAAVVRRSPTWIDLATIGSDGEVYMAGGLNGPKMSALVPIVAMPVI